MNYNLLSQQLRPGCKATSWSAVSDSPTHRGRGLLRPLLSCWPRWCVEELCLKEGFSKNPKIGPFRFRTHTKVSRSLTSNQPGPGYVETTLQVQTSKPRGKSSQQLVNLMPNHLKPCLFSISPFIVFIYHFSLAFFSFNFLFSYLLIFFHYFSFIYTFL